MKKFLASILAVIYLSTSMGATVHLHYCMGKLFSWSLVDKESKNCGQCGLSKSRMGGHCMVVKDGCCKDEYTQVKVDKDQKATEPAHAFSQLSCVALPGRLATLPDLYGASYIAGYPTTNAPPDPDKVPYLSVIVLSVFDFLPACNARLSAREQGFSSRVVPPDCLPHCYSTFKN